MKPTLIELGNDTVEVGILPEVGGRIVYLRRPGGDNILKSDPDLWERQSRRKITPTTAYVRYNGHEVWLGPQTGWWTHQDFRPLLKRKSAQWPPDPYLTMAPYEVVEHSPAKVVIQSPGSPVTGMRFVKTITLEKDGGVGFKVTGTNISRKAVSWDLWLNTRLSGYAKCYVPVREGGVLRVGGMERGSFDKMEHVVHDGYFTFETRPPLLGNRARWAKAFIDPAKPVMYGFTRNELLEITVKKYPRASMHPQQALIEIYNATSVNEPDGLLELESHGPYKTLKPGESMSVGETFRVYRYKGAGTAKAQCRFIEGLGSKNHSR